MSPAQIIAAALRELLADEPDPDQARSFLSDIPADDVYAVGSALVQMAGMLQYRVTAVSR